MCAAFLLAVVPSLASARTYTVNRTSDPSPTRCEYKKRRMKRNKCSLRAAIKKANSHGGADTIRFKVGTGGLKTIKPKTALPTITGRVVLDGWSQHGFSSKPLIEIDGRYVPTADGLRVNQAGARSTIRGLIINNFDGNGVHTQAANGVVLQGLWIGLDANGSTVQANGGAGIRLENGSNGAVIGGTGTKPRNVISGNVGDGIALVNLARGATIVGNRIGTNVAGTAGRGNSGSGIDDSYDASGHQIGRPGASNVISGNGDDGIKLADSDTGGGLSSTIRANLIGTTANGATALGNGSDGIDYLFPKQAHIGGATAAERNVISGNGGSGVYMHGDWTISTPDNWIRGNYIGVTGAGNGAAGLGNGADGIRLDSTTGGTEVGGAAAGEGNVLSGSAAGAGVDVIGTDAVKVHGNTIGLNANGQSGNAYESNVVGVQTDSSYTQIGGSASGEGNVIGNSGYAGVSLYGTVEADVRGNFIGTDSSASLDLGNAFGVLARNAAEGKVGGPAAGDRNAISYNNTGVRVQDTALLGIVGNWIALNTGLGIDLVGGTESPAGVTANDGGVSDDADTGANFLTNSPVVTAASSNTDTYTVTLDALPDTNYTIEIYVNAPGSCGASGNGSGYYVASNTLLTDGNGVGTASGSFPSHFFATKQVAATASYDPFYPSGALATSEFSPCFSMT